VGLVSNAERAQMRNLWISSAVVAIIVALAVSGYAAGVWLDLFGELEHAGTVTTVPRPEQANQRRAQDLRQARAALAVDSSKQILFGDLHVHTTFSADAFVFNLPVMQGEGAHPPADACDFARYCAALDFWSINDHAESLTERRWSETKDTIRQCNAVAGDSANPDVVAFLGWEWTQAGSARSVWGHKNVIFRDIGDDQVPARPVAAPGSFLGAVRKGFPFPPGFKYDVTVYDFANRQRYFDYFESTKEIGGYPFCEPGTHVRDLPADCLEVAETPRDLFRKLDQWGYDAIVIPHGTAWGATAPPGAVWERELADGQHDPGRQLLIEVYSGHGNSEEYRQWRAVEFGEQDQPRCPSPAHGFTPHCWRAGEIIHERCRNAGIGEAECEARAAEARLRFVELGMRGMDTVPGTTAADWLDSGQCRDCFLPAYSMRPGRSVQHALTVTGFGEGPGNADGTVASRRMRFGLIGSTDNHRARPGAGYKEFGRHRMADVLTPKDAGWAKRLAPDPETPAPRSLADPPPVSIGSQVNFERARSYLTTGGLAAVHADGRDRGAIWDALRRRETYGTSGPRILLWFELLTDDGDVLPMGSVTATQSVPRFRVKAAGSFRQRPGCPQHVLSALTPERLERLCLGECYNPSNSRYLIERIEVVRIQPQRQAGEPVAPLIESPWRAFECPADESGCVVEFDDPEFAMNRRDTLYYVRAIQEPTAAVNGRPLACDYDIDGRCIAVRPCGQYPPEDQNDDCLAEIGERAWSSPIFVDFGPIER
jgi:hypothetical protein